MGSSNPSLTISKLHSNEPSQFEENKIKGPVQSIKDLKRRCDEETLVTIKTSSPERPVAEEEMNWNFTFDSNSESLESCGSEQLIVPVPVPSAPFNMYSETVAPSPHLIVPEH